MGDSFDELTLNLAKWRDPHFRIDKFHWTATSGAPSWKGPISTSRNPGLLMTWKSLCRPSGESSHKNTPTRQWQISSSARQIDCRYDYLWLSLRASTVKVHFSKFVSSIFIEHHAKPGSHTIGANSVQNANNSKCSTAALCGWGG